MPESPFAPAESLRHRWQFSIRGLLVFTVSVAIGASFSQISLANWVAFISLDVYREYPPPPDIKTGWAGGLIAVLLFWFCLGLAHQIRDLKAWLAEHRTVERERRCAARIELAWRVAVLALFALFALTTILIDKKLLVLPEPGDRFWKVAEMFREAIFVVLLLVIVGSVPAYRPKRYWAALAYLIQAVLGVAVLAIFLKYVLEDTGLFRLFELAVSGISDSFPLRFTPNDPRLSARYSQIFFWWAAASGIVFAFNWFFVGKLARQWSAGTARRCFWLVLAALGALNTCAFAAWALAKGYPQMSPIVVESRGPITTHCCVAIIVLMAILATVFIYRMTADWQVAPGTTLGAWRRGADDYYHEWRSLLFLLGAAVVSLQVQLWYYQTTVPGLGIAEFSTFATRPATVFSFALPADWFLGRPINYLWLGLLLLALHRAICRRSRVTAQHDLPCINAACFIVLWPLVFAILLSGFFTMAWLSIAVWRNPWHYVGVGS